MKRRRRRLDPVLILTATIVGVVAVAAVFAPAIAPHDPLRPDLMESHKPPFWQPDGTIEHILGTDYLGRDLFSRIIHGSRTSLAVALGAVVVSGTTGTVLGLVSGYWGGSRIDSFVMRLVDVQLALPPILLAIAVLATIGNTMANVILVLGLVGWAQYARVIRGSVLAVREDEFIEAAVALGASSARIIFKHVLRNVTSELVVITTANVSAMILAQAALSFLGLGVPPPTPSWGAMINQGRRFLAINWWGAVFPGLAIMALVVSVNIVGDRLLRLRK